MRLQAVSRSRGWPCSPQFVDEDVTRDRLVRMQQEDREQRALLRPADFQPPPALLDLERPQNLVVHVTPAARRRNRNAEGLERQAAEPFMSGVSWSTP